MKLNTTKKSALLLLSLLILTATSSNLIASAKADEYGWAVVNPNNYVSGVDSVNEAYYTDVICDNIASYLNNYYTTNYHYTWHGSAGNPIHPSDYSTILQTLQDYCDKVTFFTKGHCTPWGYNGNHRQILCTLSSGNPPNSEQAKDSIHIWPHTGYYENRFSFIWHCGTAEMYPLSSPYQDIDGPIGMPFCFTHNVNMDYYGSSGSYVYLGWIWTSPQFDCEIPNQYWPGYYWWLHFAYYFFQELSYGYSVMQTLQDLSWAIYGQDFYQSPLNGWLVVWGNGDMTLGY